MSEFDDGPAVRIFVAHPVGLRVLAVVSSSDHARDLKAAMGDAAGFQVVDNVLDATALAATNPDISAVIIDAFPRGAALSDEQATLQQIMDFWNVLALRRFRGEFVLMHDGSQLSENRNWTMVLFMHSRVASVLWSAVDQVPSLLTDRPGHEPATQ